MKKLNEKVIKTTINLTMPQQIVLARVIQSDGELRFDDPGITGDRKLVAARDALIHQLKFLDHDMKTDHVFINDAGNQSLIENGLVDEMGQLTQKGNDVAATGAAAPTTPEEVDQAFESYSLLRELDRLAKSTD